MLPIALIGDSWAVGPAPGQPNLSASLTALNIQNVAFSSMHTSDVLALIQNYIASGGTGAQWSMVLLSTGAHDMFDGIPAAQTLANLVAIGNDCAQLGLKCEVIGVPQIVMNGTKATLPNPSVDATFYDQAAAQCSDIQILHGVVGQIVQHMPDYAVSYVAPDYENYAYSQDIPHYNQAGADAFALDLVGLYNQLNP